MRTSPEPESHNGPFRHITANTTSMTSANRKPRSESLGPHPLSGKARTSELQHPRLPNCPQAHHRARSDASCTSVVVTLSPL